MIRSCDHASRSVRRHARRTTPKQPRRGGKRWQKCTTSYAAGYHALGGRNAAAESRKLRPKPIPEGFKFEPVGPETGGSEEASFLAPALRPVPDVNPRDKRLASGRAFCALHKRTLYATRLRPLGPLTRDGWIGPPQIRTSRARMMLHSTRCANRQIASNPRASVPRVIIANRWDSFNVGCRVLHPVTSKSTAVRRLMVDTGTESNVDQRDGIGGDRD
jgi:hypothetical protein